MAYIHVAHDCAIGNNVILGNACQIAGEVKIDDWAIGKWELYSSILPCGLSCDCSKGFSYGKDIHLSLLPEETLFLMRASILSGFDVSQTNKYVTFKIYTDFYSFGRVEYFHKR